jgi:transmembrane sensor
MIDFELIWKNIHGISSEQEESQLQSWINQSEENERFYLDAKSHYHQEKPLIVGKASTKEAWKRLDLSLHKKQIRKKMIAWGSGIAASIAIMLSIIYFTEQHSNNTTMELASSTIEPGTQRAILTLNDGSIHALTTEGKIAVEDGGAKIESHNGTLEYSKQSDASATNQITYNTLEIPRGGEFFLILSDSTKVWLNSETTLKYPTNFSGDARNVELVGEAFFEVTKNKSKPFIVKSGDQIVEVLGTSFNISSYQEDSLIFTTLIEGMVKVYLENNQESQQLLYPNHQSYLYKDKGFISQRKVNPAPYIAWKEGRFYFDNQTLEEIMSTLARWYDIDIYITDDNIKKIRFTGNLKRYDEFEPILKLIQKTNEVSYAINDREVRIN